MQTQSQISQELLQPDAYPGETGPIELIQTHISFVFLTQNHVYKVKKAVNFGFLDFSSLEKRRMYCQKELDLNRRLCPEIYLEVVTINKSDRIRVGGIGEIIEYALKMKRLPQERIMSLLLKQNRVGKEVLDEIASIVATFHSRAQSTLEISEFGSLKVIKTNWDENFSQTEKYINQSIPQKDFNIIKAQIHDFMENNHGLFKSRISAGRIRDCHGDLHSGNIFVTEKICIFDAIEFNDRFRYSDVAADVAFLAMDLDFQQKVDLSNHFIERYIAYSKDDQLLRLLRFYKCYRAYVRGKVISFKLDDPNVTVQEKQSAIKEAQAYFQLAQQYAQNLST